MANLFLGFPVSRAKIAEMIEGSAPPIEHAPWHKPNGSDPLVLPIDITSGQAVGWDGTKYKGYTFATEGGPDLLENLFFQTFFESLDGFFQQKTGSANIAINEGFVDFTTGATINSVSRLYKVPYYPVPDATWSKARKFKTKVRIITGATGSPYVLLYTGSASAPHGFGFIISGHSIYGYTGNGSSGDVLLLETIPAGAYDIIRTFDAIFTPGTQVEYFIDGVSKGTIATKLPTGTSSAQYLIWISLQNLVGVNDEMMVSHWKLYQAA